MVGIYLQRSLDMLVGLLGILKVGAGYLPIDPTYPKDRIEFILEDSQVPVLLSESGLASTLDDSTARVIYLDGSARLSSGKARSRRRSTGSRATSLT